MKESIKINNSGDEQLRVEALNRYNIFDTPPEQAFDNIAKLGLQLFEVPICLITFVDTENVFVKANIGLGEIMGDITKTPKSNSLCALAIKDNSISIFNNNLIQTDPCVLTSGLFAGETGFKFYAGAPLITHDGFRIGTICIVDTAIRDFSEKNKSVLESLAVIVMSIIELRQSNTSVN